MKNFESLLQKELDKLPYTKHLDDGQYNDGQIAGFEIGARWVMGELKDKILVDFAIFIDKDLIDNVTPEDIVERFLNKK